MSLQDTQAPSSGVWQAIKGALGLFSGINKTDGVSENQNPTPIDEYTSTIPDLEIIQLIGQWKKTYNQYYSDVEPGQKLSFEYWIGKQRSEDAESIQGNSPIVDNKIFQAVETFIPIATRANPDPLVQADPSDIGQKMAHDIKLALTKEADRQKLRMILRSQLRDWLIYRIGILKISYNVILDQIETEVINPKRMIFDKDGHFDESGHFTGEYIGEKKQATASKLMEMFPKKKEYISQKSQSKKGTKLEYIEWWYRRKDVFFTLDEEVLGKYKNPHWNWDYTPETPEEPLMDSNEGEFMDTPVAPPAPPIEPIAGVNHFKEPRDPYVGLSIFSTRLQPHDETSLILQNVSMQDMVNRRYRQIDKNVEGMNNGMIVNDQFTAEQASQAASALRRGIAIRYPGKDVREAAMRFPPGDLPNIVFETLNDGRSELQNIFGTSGSTPEGVDSQDTVRGKILINQLDSSRIGGGITEFIEQVADSVYNYWVQMMFVHYTDEHYIIDAGADGGSNLITLKNTNFALLKTLDITVKEGTLIPKDPITQRNEAIDLWSAGAIDPISFYTRLDMSDPNGMAEKLLTWQMVQKGQLPPQAYLPDFGQQNPAIQQQQAMGGGGMPPPLGVGGPAVNPVGPATPGPQQVNPAPTSPQAAQNESQQLIQQIPIK